MDDREILPKALSPVNYKLHLHSIDTSANTYLGQEVIDFVAKESTNKVHLNYKPGCVKATKASATIEGINSVSVEDIDHNDAKETLTLTLSADIPKGAEAHISLEFSADIQSNMAGFYRSRYKGDNGEDLVMLSTQFESSDARRAFPCIDEPNQKASFEFSIEIPHEGWTALSNMPIASESVADNGKKVVTYEKAPKMSTYLYAWALGEFEYIEDFTDRTYNGKKLPVRVYTTKGLKEQGRLALQSATKIIDFFSTVFGIDYVLPKCDLLAVHEFTHGAMENWGLITYRTTAVLFDEETSESAYKTRVVYVVAHELAHQWFGNLVTMDWWNELWLNEGFATWVGWFAVDHLYPEWDVFSRFVSEALQQALSLDGLRGSHPIEVPVRSGLEVDQIFDHISYLKGASSIRMLSTNLGVDTFLKGVSQYLKKHQYGNAKTTDLWAALSDVSGVDVAKQMHNWTNKIGFPILDAKYASDGDKSRIQLSQRRFLASGDVTAEEDTTVWWIPLAVSSGKDKAPRHDSLTDRTGEVSDLGDGFFKLNKDQVGVYRVCYSEELLDRIGKYASELSNKDKVGLVADAGAAALEGSGSSASVLNLIEQIGVSSETDHYVWSEIISRLRAIRTAWSEGDEDIKKSIAAFARKIVEPVVNTLRWTTEAQDDYVWIENRALIFSMAVDLGIESVVAEAQKRFKQWVAGDKSSIHPSLRRAVYSANIQYAQGEDLQAVYQYLVKEVNDSETVDGRELAASALGKVKTSDLIAQNLDMLLQVKIPVQDVHSLVNQLAANPAARGTTWEFFKKNWDTLYKEYASNMIIFERMVRLLLTSLVSEKDYNDVKAFFKDKDQSGYDRAVQQGLDTIKTRYQWTKRDTQVVQQWLANH